VLTDKASEASFIRARRALRALEAIQLQVGAFWRGLLGEQKTTKT